MYKVEQKHIGRLDRYLIINLLTEECVSVIPEFGANINELVLKKESKFYSILDGETDQSCLEKNAFFKGAFLVPFPNRIKNGEYTFEGKSFSLNKNDKSLGHAIHGFVFDQKFEVSEIETTNTYGRIILTYCYDGNIKGYPFPFTYSIQLELNKSGLLIRMQVENTGNKSLPLACGWHPYFKLDQAVDELNIQLPKSEMIQFDDRIIPVGEFVKNHPFEENLLINNTNLDAGFKITDEKEIASTKLYSAEQDVGIKIWQETGPGKYNYLQIYTPPTRSSIAIEPMTSNINAFNNKAGLIILEPGDLFDAPMGVELY